MASYRQVLESWRTDHGFSVWFNDLLAQSPFSAFRWETPPVSDTTLDRPFEFVLLDSPGLARRPDPSAFAGHFLARPEADVLAFENLGGDATMIVPRAVGPDEAYVHLGAFVRGAPKEQRVALWRQVGLTMMGRVSQEPVWLSSAGAGVAWLHVRVDDRPKYYGFHEYRTLRPD